MSVDRAKHLTVNGTDTVEFTSRRNRFVITNLHTSEYAYCAFDGAATFEGDETFVVGPLTTRAFDLHRGAKSVALATSAAVELHVEAF